MTWNLFIPYQGAGCPWRVASFGNVYGVRGEIEGAIKDFFTQPDKTKFLQSRLIASRSMQLTQQTNKSKTMISWSLGLNTSLSALTGPIFVTMLHLAQVFICRHQPRMCYQPIANLLPSIARRDGGS